MPLRIRGLAAAAALLTPACAAVEPAPVPAYTPTYTMPVANSSVQLPDWAEAIPSSADLMRVYPTPALADGIEGEARLRCTVMEDRHVDCAVESETPSGAGFGRAALKLAPLFVIREGHPAAAPGGRVAIPVRFALEG